MRSDVNYSHSKNIGETVGDFHGVPICSYDPFELELDVESDVSATVLRNQTMGCSDIPNTAEILPGEVLCTDNIVRRTTAAEAIGYDEFKERQPIKILVGTGDGATYSPEDNQWHMKEKKARQSTPEELCAWLNDLPNQNYGRDSKRSFKSEVVTEGDDKIIRTTDKAGNLLYATRYVGGVPGTYIGGDESRLLDTPQVTVGINSPSHVVQYYDNGNAVKANPEPPKDYRDEWRQAERYTPTPNVSRSTIGGTALFDELKTAIELDKVCAEPEIKLAQPQTCEWYPDSETRCINIPTHAATKEKAGTCDRCYAQREARG